MSDSGDEFGAEIVDEFSKLKQEVQLEAESDLEIIDEVPGDVAGCSQAPNSVNNRSTSFVNDIPNGWTKALCKNFQAIHRWLMVQNGKLGCKTCMNVYQGQKSKDNGSDKGTRKTVADWRTCQIISHAHSAEAKQANLRKKIAEHKNSKAHIQAVVQEHLMERIALYQRLVKIRNLLDTGTLIKIFNSAYHVIQRKQPVHQFTSVCLMAEPKMFETCGITPERLFVALINHVAFQLRKFKVTRMMSENHKKISIVIHETGIMNRKAALALHFKFHNNGKSQRADTCVFFDLLPLTTSSPEEVVILLMNCLQTNNITKEYLRTNLVSFIFDERSQLLGLRSNLSAILRQQVTWFPNVVIVYDLDRNLNESVRNLYEEIGTGVNLQHTVFSTNVMADSMFVSISGPPIEYFNAAKMVENWLKKETTDLQQKDTSIRSGICFVDVINADAAPKISNDMALAAEANDEQRLVIDLNTESNSNSHQETDADAVVVVDNSSSTAAILDHNLSNDNDDNGESRIKRKRKSWRQTDTRRSSDFDNDIVEKVVQRVRETPDLCGFNEDTDRLFLLSLLPFMKKLSTRENLEFRMEVQQLLQKKASLNGHQN